MPQISTHKAVLDEAHVLIVTTNDTERRAALGLLTNYWEVATSVRGSQCRCYLGHDDGHFVVVVDGAAGISRQDSATRFAIDYLGARGMPIPKLVLLCGVGWGNPKKTSIGDVLVATTVLSLNRSRSSPDGPSYVPSYTYSKLDTTIELPTLGYRVILDATICSLEQLVTDDTTRDALVSEYPIDGGEMEAFGLVPKCESVNVPWAIVKGIADHGGDDFHRDAQNLAAGRACTVAQIVLRQILPVASVRARATCVWRTTISSNNWTGRKLKSP